MKIYFIVFCVVLLTGTGCADNSFRTDSGFISVEGGKLFYELAGSGETIVLLHDGMVHREIWNDQFPLLAKNYMVVRYDRRGFGNSTDPDKAYSEIEDLNQVFTQLKIEKAVIFGMSAGGGLAIDFTLKYPSKVTALVLVGSIVSGLGYTSHMVTRGGHMDINIDFNDWNKLTNYFINDDPYEIYEGNKKAKEKVTELMKSNMHPQNYFARRPSRDAVKFLNEITVPALILAGEFDIPDVHAHAGAINGGIKNSTRKIIPRSGHLIPIEQPELFNKAVEDFLADLRFEKMRRNSK